MTLPFWNPELQGMPREMTRLERGLPTYSFLWSMNSDERRSWHISTIVARDEEEAMRAARALLVPFRAHNPNPCRLWLDDLKPTLLADRVRMALHE